MKYLFLGLLLVGCSNVDEHGITDRITSNSFMTRSDACKHLSLRFDIVCRKSGYESYKELEAYSMKIIRGMDRGNFICRGTAQCKGKNES